MTETKRDYRETLFLPKTDFPMRAGLPKREPQWLERWTRIGLYDRQREHSKGRKPYTLHDGPPYANGHIHMGTALNKTHTVPGICPALGRYSKRGISTPWRCRGLEKPLFDHAA